VFRNRFVSVLEMNDYVVETRLVNTMEHGLPQHRERTYIVAILKSSLRKKFIWPEPLPHTLPLQRILVGPVVSRVADMLPPLDPNRTLVLNALKKIALQGKELHVGNLIVVELGCTPKFCTHRINEFPSITATRASSCDWWVVNLGRRVTLIELMQLQGLNPSEFPYHNIVSHKRFGHMIGNAMSANVLERLLPVALASVGLHPQRST